MKLSFVVPVYHGEDTIEPLFERIVSFCNEFNYTYEVIFVWDCGPDNSWAVIEKLKSQNPDVVTGIRLSRNFGQHNALICGFSKAKGRFIVTLDEDLQQDPYDVDKLLNKQLIDDYDVVYGKFPEQKHSLFRNSTSRMIKEILKHGIPDLHQDYSPLRLIKREIAELIPEMHNSYTFLDGYITWLTKSVTSTDAVHYNRLAGKSSYTIKKLIEHTINIFVTFSNIPIRILTSTSILIFAFTIIYSIIILAQKIEGTIKIPGYSSLMILIGLSTGFIMAGLGIIGEYLYRMNQKTTKKPNFIISKTI